MMGAHCACAVVSFVLSEVITPVYTSDSYCGNSMQYLEIALVNQVRFSVPFVAAISQGFRTCWKLVATLSRQKLHRVAAAKIACVNGPLEDVVKNESEDKLRLQGASREQYRLHK